MVWWVPDHILFSYSPVYVLASSPGLLPPPPLPGILVCLFVEQQCLMIRIVRRRTRYALLALFG